MIITILSPFDLVLAILPLYVPYFFGKLCISFVYLVVEGFFVISQSFFPRGRADTFVLFRSVITKIARDLCRVQDVFVYIKRRTKTTCCKYFTLFVLHASVKNHLGTKINKMRKYNEETKILNYNKQDTSRELL